MHWIYEDEEGERRWKRIVVSMFSSLLEKVKMHNNAVHFLWTVVVECESVRELILSNAQKTGCSDLVL
jgi:hypothetical protein